MLENIQAYWKEHLPEEARIDKRHNVLILGYPKRSPITDNITEVSAMKSFRERNHRNVSIGDLSDPFGRFGLSGTEKTMNKLEKELQEYGFEDKTFQNQE
jgi:hypothetical protein